MRFACLFTLVMLTLLSCQDKTSGAKNGSGERSDSISVSNSDDSKKMRDLIDSIRQFKPIKLSFNADQSDVDELIPVGVSPEASFAFILNRNGGGASTVHFEIASSNDPFSMQADFDMENELDTILIQNKELFFYALKSSGVRLQNSVRVISMDSLKQYVLKFDITRYWGYPNKDDPSGKKILNSISIKYHKGDQVPISLIEKSFSPDEGVYDVYISDCIAIQGKEGVYGFAVKVTESAGFEGYTRKAVEIVPVGLIE